MPTTSTERQIPAVVEMIRSLDASVLGGSIAGGIVMLFIVFFVSYRYNWMKIRRINKWFADPIVEKLKWIEAHEHKVEPTGKPSENVQKIQEQLEKLDEVKDELFEVFEEVDDLKILEGELRHEENIHVLTAKIREARHKGLQKDLLTKAEERLAGLKIAALK